MLLRRSLANRPSPATRPSNRPTTCTTPHRVSMRTLSSSIASARAVAGASQHYPHGMESLSKGATTIQEALKRLGPGIEQVPLEGGKSPFVKPTTLYFELDGKRRRWDAVESHDSIGVVIFHTQRNAFVIVRQFRPAVYAAAARSAADAAKHTGSTPVAVDMAEGFTYELCAGILDKDMTLEEICAEEIAEETGYAIPPAGLRYIGSTISSSGTAGSRHYMYYAEVNDAMRNAGGGGLVDHGEIIEVLSVPLDAVDAFVVDDACHKSPGLMFGLSWAAARIRAGELGAGNGAPISKLMNDSLTLRPVPPA